MILLSVPVFSSCNVLFVQTLVLHYFFSLCSSTCDHSFPHSMQISIVLPPPPPSGFSASRLDLFCNHSSLYGSSKGLPLHLSLFCNPNVSYRGSRGPFFLFCDIFLSPPLLAAAPSFKHLQEFLLVSLPSFLHLTASSSLSSTGPLLSKVQGHIITSSIFGNYKIYFCCFLSKIYFSFFSPPPPHHFKVHF